LNVVGAILARGGSKGISHKNVRLLGGKPLIAWAIDIAKQCPSIGRVVVSTDDPETAAIAKEYGAEVPFIRPHELATDEAPRWLVWRHLVEELERPGYRVDIVADLQVPAPFRSIEDVERCIEELRSGDADAVITIYEADRNPYFNMVEIRNDGYLEIAKPLPERPSNRQQAPKVYSMTTVCLAVRGAFAKRGVHLFEGKVRGVVVPPERALDIDSELNWAFAEFLISRGTVG
jgi:N-acylneuraminate cytidylyltransferase